ncbi:hypothetical protein NDU88_006049 [Pleurodeles waltl]|uniref:Uncharacterized protein n=1 Tax=Pleurodeles waltl TaxID=8319 RepID=A0AAV7PLD6_PLEWA|nr:hypothetical protein NDU88_006049 [Pleurodeles waltl]
MKTGRVREKDDDEQEGEPRSQRSVAFTGMGTSGRFINNIKWKGGKERELYTGEGESGYEYETVWTSEIRQNRKRKTLCR